MFFPRLTTLALVLLPLAFSSCTTGKYSGETFAPTEHVEVFYYTSDMPTGYRVMGTERVDALDSTTEEVVEKMKAKALSVGADAVWITGLETDERTETTTWGGGAEPDANADSSSGVAGSPPAQNTSTVKHRVTVMTAQFLRRTGAR